MRDNKKLSRQVTITIPSELLNKYKSIEYLRNAEVASFSELVRRAMYYYDKQLTNSSNELKVRPLDINWTN
mgnify:FL=1